MDDSHAVAKRHLPLFEEGASAPGGAEVVPLTREQRRSRRARAVRARTVSVKRMTKRELELGRLLYPETESERPRTRGECAGGERPCPFVSCAHHLYLDVSPKTGAIKLNFPDLEVHELRESCALDVADYGGESLEDVGRMLNLTRERIRQLEMSGKAKVRAATDANRKMRETFGEAIERELADRPEEGEAEPRLGESIADEFDVETFVALEDAAP